MQFAVQPAANVPGLTRCRVATKSLDLVITKIPLVYRTTFIGELPFSVDNSMIIVALEEVPVFKSYLSLAMFLVFEPFTNELSPACVLV